MARTTDLDPGMVLAGFEGTMEQLRPMPSRKPDPNVLLGMMSCAASPAFEHGQALAVRVYLNNRCIAAGIESRWL